MVDPVLATLASHHHTSDYSKRKGASFIYRPLDPEQLLLLESKRVVVRDWWPCEPVQTSGPPTADARTPPHDNLENQLAAALTETIPRVDPGFKTSLTHPLAISSLLPPDGFSAFLSQQLKPSSTATVFDLDPTVTLDRLLLQPHDHSNRPLPPPPPPPLLITQCGDQTSLRDALQAALTDAVTDGALSIALTCTVALETRPPIPQIGNFLLCSCPGKKVRLHGPVKGRSGVCRDLDVDLQRIKRLGVGCIICCLDDDELSLLGVPWYRYEAACQKLGLCILRIPLPEGLAPESPAALDDQLARVIDQYTLRGVPIACHCRAGLGRAGVIACCWTLKLGLMGWLEPEGFNLEDASSHRPDVVSLVERTISVVRRRRGCKAVETFEQVAFIADYIEYLRTR
ncbi:TYR-PHOSPHATASE-2 domain-containing protein [Mycena chlorophos]|uniref:TYR-PHOSPHATASE-2 domain-containing protein n=1 Tax=Mycena chlorophos TaxID=658473 RepID=A0A8H6SET9_MYCCL|nr:TYR-PHOSPHATASE-2 domain-containing protein [Mycena chlorophos]